MRTSHYFTSLSLLSYSSLIYLYRLMTHETAESELGRTSQIKDYEIYVQFIVFMYSFIFSLRVLLPVTDDFLDDTVIKIEQSLTSTRI